MDKKEYTSTKEELAKIAAKKAANRFGGPLASKAVDVATNKLGKNNNTINNPQLNNKFQSNNTEIENESSTLDNEIEKPSVSSSGGFLSGFNQGLFGGIFGNSKGKNLLEKQIEKKKRKIILTIIGIAVGVMASIIILLLLVSIIYTPFLYFGDSISKAGSGVGSFLGRIGNWFIGNGYCIKEECPIMYEEKFYKKLETVDQKYRRKGVAIDTELLLATVLYVRDDETIDEDLNNNVYEIGDAYEEGRGDISKLAFHMVKEVDNSAAVNACYAKCKKDDEKCTAGCDLIPRVIYELDYNQYKEYLEDEYIPKKFNLNKQKDAIKIEDIIDDIYSIAKLYHNIYYERGYDNFTNASCSYVTFTNGEQVLFEDYVAGLITAKEPESMKAQAIAIRTYVMTVTNSCSTPIDSDYVKATDPATIQATTDTKGLIMVIDNQTFPSNYDDFYTEVETDSLGRGSYYCDSNYCYSNYTRNGLEDTEWEVQKVKIPISMDPISSNGHGSGMSIIAANYMAQQGNSYEEILKYFYAEGMEISKITDTVNGEYTPGNLTAVDVDVANKALFRDVDNAGYCSRAGTVAASEFLAYKYYRIEYEWGGKYGYLYNWGVDKDWGTLNNVSPDASEHGPTSDPPHSGLDCSGFISWSTKNGGYYSSNVVSGRGERYTESGASKVICIFGTHPCSSEQIYSNGSYLNESYDQIYDFNKLQAGDIVTKNGHYGMIISVNKVSKTYTVAHVTGTIGMSIDTFSSDGLLISGTLNTERGIVLGSKYFTGVILMDGFYNNNKYCMERG